MDPLEMERAGLPAADFGGMGWPDRGLLSLGQSLLSTATNKTNGPLGHLARTGFQVAAHPMALLATLRALQSRKVPPSIRPTPLTHRRFGQTTCHSDELITLFRFILPGCPQMLAKFKLFCENTQSSQPTL